MFPPLDVEVHQLFDPETGVIRECDGTRGGETSGRSRAFETYYRDGPGRLRPARFDKVGYDVSAQGGTYFARIPPRPDRSNRSIQRLITVVVAFTGPIARLQAVDPVIAYNHSPVRILTSQASSRSC